ncbi:hypothetical protein DER44DRAFT_795747 [Fusarium oxysporum]|nr:hypothetical protein DER44DRAFT_795747 [Fusarium oxysporum]
MEVNSNNMLIGICAKRKRNEEFSEAAKALIIREVETGRLFRDVALDAKTSSSNFPPNCSTLENSTVFGPKTTYRASKGTHGSSDSIGSNIN